MGLFGRFSKAKTENKQQNANNEKAPTIVELHEPMDEKGRTALQSAAEEGNLGSVIMQLSLGAEVDHRDKDGNTALHIAVVKGHLSVVAVLLEHGADIDAKGARDIVTPIMLAMATENTEAVSLLISHGAALSPQLFEIANSYNNPTITKMLFEAGACKDAQHPEQKGNFNDPTDKYGRTRLQNAALEGNLDNTTYPYRYLSVLM